jgi:hypothetical protein
MLTLNHQIHPNSIKTTISQKLSITTLECGESNRFYARRHQYIMLINNGGQYLNPEFQWATRDLTRPQQVKFDNCTDFDCYTTSVVGNASILLACTLQ